MVTDGCDANQMEGRTATSEDPDRCICILGVHDDTLPAEDVVYNPTATSGVTFREGTLLKVEPKQAEGSELRSRSTGKPSTRPEARSLLFVARKPTKDLSLTTSNLQLSISSRISQLFDLKRGDEVQLSQVNLDSHIASHVEIAFRDVYLTRASMRLIAASITGRTVYVGQHITYLGSVRASVKGVYQDGRKVRCAFFSPKTKPIFRSESSRFIIYVQMSREMWEFDPNESGDIIFDKVVDGLLPELFRRWSAIGARHLVSVVFFTRIEYAISSTDEPPTDALTSTRDFFRVVVAENSSADWMHIIRRLKTDFQNFLPEILMFESPETVDTTKIKDSVTIPPTDNHRPAIIDGRPTGASEGNILEAINTASSPFSRDFIDTDLVRTGLSIVLITPGSGIFNVDEQLLRLTTENLVNNGINIDLLCLSQPPLHCAPLFRYKPGVHGISATSDSTTVNTVEGPKPMIYASTPPLKQMANLESSIPIPAVRMATLSRASASEAKVSVMPHWVHLHFWHHSPDLNQKHNGSARIKDRRLQSSCYCSMSDVQSNGIMESETCRVCIPLVRNISGNRQVAVHPHQPVTSKQLDNTNIVQRGLKQHTPSQLGLQLKVEVLHGELDDYDHDLFSAKSAQTQQTQAPDRPISPLSFVRHRSRDDEAQTQSSRDCFHGSPPTKESHLTMLYPRYRAEAGLSDLSSSRPPPIFRDRPAVLERKISTTSSHLSGVFDRRSFLPTSRGLSIGKASASIAQPTTQLDDKSDTVHSAEHMKNDQEHDTSQYQAHRPESTSFSRSMVSKTSQATLVPPCGAISMLPAPLTSADTMHSLMPHQPGAPSVNSGKIQAGHERSELESEQQSFLSSQSRVSSQGISAEIPFSVARWLIVTNPAKAREWQLIDHGWANAFTSKRQAVALSMKWKSLCSPASLPLTSDHVIRRCMLPFYEERTHRVSLDDDESAEPGWKARTHLLGQLMAYRLAKGFQTVKGSTDDDFCPFDDEMLKDDGRQIFLMKGNTVHVLLATDNDIQINMYQPKTATADSSTSEIYRPLIKSTLEPTYEQVAVPLTLARDEHNWSTIDNYIAGHLEYFSGATGFWRARFSLVPVEPMRQIRKNDDSNDELRIEGILRLSQIWHRATVSDGNNESAGSGQKNPLGIEFQTRDLSAVLSAGLEDSLLSQGQTVVRSTQLISDEVDQYRSDDLDLTRLATDLQGPHGIMVKDRRWYLKLHRRAFVGLDLTAWLEKHFDDISNRDQAEELGDKLMEMGLFKHVRSTHKFRDGNYFYQFMPDYQLAKAKVLPSTSPSPRTAIADVPNKGTRNVSAKSTHEHGITKSGEVVVGATPKPHIYLTAKLHVDIDTRKKSDREERVNLHYDRVCNPESCYHFRLEWMSATEKLVEEAITSWATTSERYGWKLVQAPTTEACKIAKVNPFRTPTVIVFAVPPPEQEPDLSHVDSTAPEPLPTHRYHPYQRALLKRFDFVMDVEAAVNHPSDIELRYSYANEAYSYSQYMHKTGTLMAQVDIDGRLLLVANRLANNRSSFARDAAARMEKREHDRVTSGNMPSHSSTSTLNQSPFLGSPRSYGMAQHLERASPQPFIPQTPEQVKESLQTFCANKDALLHFYDEVLRRDPLLSPASTPAVGPRQALSTRSTPMLQATIPTLELPMSGISQLLSLSNTATPLSGPATPDAYLTKRDRSQS